MNNCIICGEPTGSRKLCLKRECKSQHSRNTMNANLAKHGGEITRFRRTNGMHRPEVRADVSRKLVAMGWGPTVRGGNGTGPTRCELLLSEKLGWPTNVIVKPGMGRGNGYPTHYKLDIAHEGLKIAIEVDGNSHMVIDRKIQDLKKADWLISKGWKVIRFKNSQVESDLDGCIAKIKELM